MTAASQPAPEHERVIRALVDAGELACMDLRAWMKNYGYDLSTALVIIELEAAIKKSRA